MDFVHQLTHEVDAQAADLALGKFGFQVGLFHLGGVKWRALIAHCDHDGVALQFAIQIQSRVSHADIGVFNDIRGGFVCGELQGVNFFFGKTARARNLGDELADFIQKLKFGWVSILWHGSRRDNETRNRPMKQFRGGSKIEANAPRVLEISYGFNRVIEGFEEFSETGKFEGFADSLRDLH